MLDALTASGGCCCREELFWHGLQLALINTPDYSTIFCFTDAGAHDAELMDGVLALVAAKHCQVSRLIDRTVLFQLHGDVNHPLTVRPSAQWSVILTPFYIRDVTDNELYGNGLFST